MSGRYLYIQARHLKYGWDSKQRHRHNPSVWNTVVIGDRVLKHIDQNYNSVSQRKNIPFALHLLCFLVFVSPTTLLPLSLLRLKDL